MNLVDTHLHLTDTRFGSDRTAVLKRAAEVGVTRMITIGTTLKDAKEALNLAESEFDGTEIFVTAGFHPHEAAHFRPEAEPELRQLWQNPRVVAVGEIGLDFHYNFAPRDVQRRVFERHLELALEVDLPIVLHCRESFDDLIEILHARRDSSLRGVFHSFSEGPKRAEQALELGFWLGFGGIMTFPRSDDVRESAQVAGLDRILLETDAPYLAPVPVRGKRNEPAFVRHTVGHLADVLDTTVEEVARRTTLNAMDLFNLPRETDAGSLKQASACVEKHEA